MNSTTLTLGRASSADSASISDGLTSEVDVGLETKLYVNCQLQKGFNCPLGYPSQRHTLLGIWQISRINELDSREALAAAGVLPGAIRILLLINSLS